MNPLACLYHSFTEFKVVFRVKSNMNKIATASLLTSGSMDTNSRWPPRSQICVCLSHLALSWVMRVRAVRPCGRVVWSMVQCVRHNDAHPCPWHRHRQRVLTENVISVFLIVIAFSMKFTPRVWI